MFRRTVVAAVALALGLAVSAGLLLYGSVSSRMVLAVARDLPAGAPLGRDSVRPVRAALDTGQAAAGFSAAEAGAVAAMRARHELSAGQLLQRSDVEPPSATGGEVLVAVPIRDLPPVRPGDHLDLISLSGTGERMVAQPFAWSVPVESVAAGFVVLRVRGRQELAFVYAAGAMRLAGVVTGAGGPAIGAAPITSAEQAIAAAAR